jgi:hypothetical protein
VAATERSHRKDSRLSPWGYKSTKKHMKFTHLLPYLVVCLAFPMAVSSQVLGEPVVHYSAEQTLKALDEVSECIEGTGRAAARSLERYFDAVKPAETPSLDRIPKLQLIARSSDCVADTARGAVLSPSLRTAVARYQDNLSEAVPLLNQAADYYSFKNYKDDGFKAARDLHARLVVIQPKLAESATLVHELISPLRAATRQRLLAEYLSSYGPTSRKYLDELSVVRARALITAINTARFEALNEEKIRTAVGEFEALGKEDEVGFTKLRPLRCDDWRSPRSETSYREVLRSAKDLWRRVRDKQSFTEEEQRKMLENPCPLVRAGSEDPASVEGSPIAIVLTLAQMDQSLATDPLMLQELQRRSSAERSAKRAEVSSQHLPVISPAEHRQSATGSDIRGVPYFESGRAIGQRVFALRDGSLYERIGLRNGDIVTEVDGEPVSSSSRLSEMFPSDLKQGEAVTIVVLRSGERVTLGYRLGSK